MSDETELENEIKQYKEQIAQINLVLENQDESIDNAEFFTLKNDLEEILKLTEESLLDLKKQNMLKKLDSMESNTVVISKDDEMQDLVATKCRVYFDCKNTNIKMHNALILGVDSEQDHTLRVIFCNPTQTNMKICDHFMNDCCKFEANCKYSHGYQVKLEDLHSYLEPNYENIKKGKVCLAKHTDELWHLAEIQSFDQNKIYVQYKKFNQSAQLNWESVLILDNPNDDSTSEDSSDYSDSEFESYEPNLYINRPTTSKESNQIGDWEKFTKGIGSKLLAKMGYKTGSGLGKSGEGRLEPVEVIVLPDRNISLDKAMLIKQKKLLKKEKKMQEKPKNKQDINVFDFINNKLSTQKADKSEKKEDVSSINSKDLNLKILNTHLKIEQEEKNILKLKESLKRNKNGDKSTIDKIKLKLNESEQNLAKLKKSESDIFNEKNNRKKKSDIF